jgi:hypothetical protein
MVFGFFVILDFATIEMMLVSIPESLGLLVFGVALVAIAVIGRWLLARGQEVEEKKEIIKKAEVR